MNIHLGLRTLAVLAFVAAATVVLVQPAQAPAVGAMLMFARN